MFRIVSLFIINTLALIIALPVQGSDSKTSYTVNDLVEHSLRRSELIIASEKSRESARWAKDQAKAWPNPFVSLGGGYKSNSGKNGFSYDAGIAQPFYAPGKLALAGEIAGIQEKLGGLSLTEARLFIRYGVIRLAYQYAVADELSKHLEERVARFKIIKKHLSSRPFLSPQKRMEKHIVEMKLVLLQKELAAIQSGKEIAWAKLNLFLDFRAPVTLASPWFIRGRVLEWDKLAATVDAGNLDIRRQAFVLERTEAETKLARKFIFPDFSLSLSYAEERVAKDVERFAGAGITFNIPLWNTNRAGVKSLEAAASSEKAKLDFAKREAYQALASSFIEYEFARANLERLPLSILGSVHARLNDADDAFDKGLIDLVTYVELENQAYETHYSVFGGQYDYVEKYVSLLVLQGNEDFALSSLK